MTTQTPSRASPEPRIPSLESYAFWNTRGLDQTRWAHGDTYEREEECEDEGAQID